MNSHDSSCKYCHQPLQETKCPKQDMSGWSSYLPDIIGTIVIFIVLLISFFTKNKQATIVKTTCINKDCIEYLKACFENNKGLYS